MAYGCHTRWRLLTEYFMQHRSRMMVPNGSTGTPEFGVPVLSHGMHMTYHTYMHTCEIPFFSNENFLRWTYVCAPVTRKLMTNFMDSLYTKHTSKEPSSIPKNATCSYYCSGHICTRHTNSRLTASHGRKKYYITHSLYILVYIICSFPSSRSQFT